MFRKIECLVPVCDRCGRDAEDVGDFVLHYSTEHEAKENLDYSECYEINDRLLCSSCWIWGGEDDDERVERPAIAADCLKRIEGEG